MNLQPINFHPRVQYIYIFSHVLALSLWTHPCYWLGRSPYPLPSQFKTYNLVCLFLFPHTLLRNPTTCFNFSHTIYPTCRYCIQLSFEEWRSEISFLFYGRSGDFRLLNVQAGIHTQRYWIQDCRVYTWPVFGNFCLNQFHRNPSVFVMAGTTGPSPAY